MIKKIISIFLLSCFLAGSLWSQEKKTEKKEEITINKQFWFSFSKIPNLKRDEFLDKKLDSLFSFKAKALRVDQLEHYNKKYRIVLKDLVAAKKKINLRYYIFTNSEDLIKTIEEGKEYKFKGIFKNFTSLNLDKTKYFFDIILPKA